MSDLVARLLFQGDGKGAVAAGNEVKKTLGDVKTAANDTGSALDRSGAETEQFTRKLRAVSDGARPAAAGVRDLAAAEGQLALAQAESAAGLGKFAAASGIGQLAVQALGTAIGGVIGNLAGGLIGAGVTAGVELLTHALFGNAEAAAEAEKQHAEYRKSLVRLSDLDAEFAILSKERAGLLDKEAAAAERAALSARNHAVALVQERVEIARNLVAQAQATLTKAVAGANPRAQYGQTATERAALDAAQQRLYETQRDAVEIALAPKVVEAHGRVAKAARERGLALDYAGGMEDHLAAAARSEAQATEAARKAAEAQAKVENDRALKLGAFHGTLNEHIADEIARGAAIAASTKAEVDYARAMFERQQIEAAGVPLTEAQVVAIKAKADALFRASAIADHAELDKRAQAELAAVGMTRREREIEARALDLKSVLMREQAGLTDEEALARARILALEQQSNVEAAGAIAKLKTDLRDAFIESGHLGFDDVGDYVEKRLRQAVYDALLAKPIDILINAVVGQVSGLTNAIGGTSGAGSALAGLMAMGIGGGATLGGALGNAGIGALGAKAVGIKGTGSTALNAGLAIGGSVLGSAAAGTIGAGVTGLSLAAGVGGGASLVAGNLAALAAGPIGAAIALAVGGLLATGLFKDTKRPYARTDLGVVDGQFAVKGSTSEDGGDTSDTTKIAQSVVSGLNAAATAFGLDLSKVDASFQAVIGAVSGKKTGALGDGYFGGSGGSYQGGATFTGETDPEKLATEVVKDTLIKAIDAGAGQFTEAEKRIIQSAGDLDQAAAQISTGRSIAKTIDDAILQLTDPAAFERKKALDAVEESYQALKTQAQQLVAAGLADPSVMDKVEQLHTLDLANALKNLGETVVDTTSKIQEAADLRASIDDQILELTDPAAFARKQALDAIEKNYTAMKTQAEALIASGAAGADLLERLDVLHGDQITDALNRLAEGATQAATALQKSATDLGGSIDDQLLQLTNPDAYKLKQIVDPINAMRDQAKPLVAAGLLDANVFDKLDELQARRIDEAFNPLIEKVEETTDAFADARPALQRWLDQLGGQTELNPAERFQSAQASYDRLLERARRGDADALGQITDQADQLISADRAANSSSSDRAARAAKIRGDIAALAATNGSDSLANALAVKGKMEVANLPALQQVYATVQQSQTGSLLGGIDKLESGLGGKVEALNKALADLGDRFEGGLTSLGAGLGASVSALASQVGDQVVEQRQTNQYVRATA